ncbi:RagB/SusD family nutrient uptake outer membrane protein [Polaribacter batillariae]|uniref:RagB/SusD family nutrient uptake outer membrane protein n=1 Tax=Polaribacter batillariae TaxID=2808900 RepID=A0ABX7SW23_9FLAO|nr:RagB/SusD family nutrient uptake outer membrane protein [Polaribacter batillariae]QTD38452.1 RagB/SusD family nutrient uptake outer membrane protein [Polaribacter batillariae]
MKKYILVIIALIAFTSCEDELDKTRLDVIGGDTVWQDEALINAYFANIYQNTRLTARLPTNVSTGGDYYIETTVSDEGRWRGNGGSYLAVTGDLGPGSDNTRGLGYWGNGTWQLLRIINVAIKELENATSLTETFRNTRLGQAHFFRAQWYFNKVKRYGGIPIIREPQDANLSGEELLVPRNTEKETYDFIEEDLNKAIVLLKGKSLHVSEVSLWAAHALRSRAMLYAGSIAENDGKLALKTPGGLTGINTSEANGYYAKSLESSRALLPAPLGSGIFSLRPGNTVSAYRKIFDEVGSGADTETIMSIEFPGIPATTNLNSMFLLPRQTPDTHSNWGNSVFAYYETTEWFEYKDGTPGNELPTGYPDNGSRLLEDNLGSGVFHDINELWGNKDPRFAASIAAYGRLEYGNATAYLHDAVTDANAASSAGVPTRGPNQTVGNGARSAISAYKLANLSSPQLDRRIDGNNPLFAYRLGEIYLNLAEAAYATGNTGDALMAINAIRQRVGLPLKGAVTLDDIKQERRVELIFEYHRYWDLKRWREAINPLSTQYRGLDFTWDVENDLYALKIRNDGEQRTRFFTDRHYYLPIPFAAAQANGWTQNAGYE